MSIRKKSILTILAIMLIGTAPAWSQSLLKKLDPDNDGTVDLAEAKNAASKLFEKLDRDHDGTLDKRELRGQVSAKDFAVADPDKDGTLDKNEFLALVEKRFKAADPDNDGTIDAKELKSAAGRATLEIIFSLLASSLASSQSIWAGNLRAREPPPRIRAGHPGPSRYLLFDARRGSSYSANAYNVVLAREPRCPSTSTGEPSPPIAVRSK
jgi:Ca2+-binding EF-hand superfamily protein